MFVTPLSKLHISTSGFAMLWFSSDWSHMSSNGLHIFAHMIRADFNTNGKSLEK